MAPGFSTRAKRFGLEHKSTDYPSQLVPPPLHGVSDHMTESGRFGLAQRESVPKKICISLHFPKSHFTRTFNDISFWADCRVLFERDTFSLYWKNFGARSLISGRHGNWEGGTERRKSHTTESLFNSLTRIIKDLGGRRGGFWRLLGTFCLLFAVPSFWFKVEGAKWRPIPCR